MALFTDVSLWDLVTKAEWGSHDFSPLLTSFHVQVITQAQLNAFSQAGV